ncbi:MAG TPA: MMPL family transporter [Solirubrobacterales bacterium]|nr:MMPL family transporter [Solirubrobacterales bacterium]
MPRRRGRGPADSAHSDSGDRPPFTLRHPRAVLVVAFVVLLVLGLIGARVERKLEPTTLDIPGTQTSRANALLGEHFGDSAPFVILLRGPAAALDHQGPALIRALRRDPRVSTLSPWDRGAVGRLRPNPREALILADFHVDISTAVNDTVPRLERTLEEQIHAPVRATQSGFATISRAIQDESISSSERGELLAIPFLLLVLLLVFRSPVAAAIPLGFGAVTVVASRGILYFFTSWFSIDAFALTVCTMMGLALGVDYALLMVSRFREELAAGVEPLEAARRTRHTAGRTTVFAGSTLLLSMLVSIFVVPGPLLASLAGTVAMVVVLSVTVATVVGPALLVLIGPNIDRWRIGPAPSGSSRLMTLVGAALKRPAPIAALIGAVVLVLAAPALALKTGPPSTAQLPEDAPARQDAELIGRTIGPGFEAPYQLIVASKDGPITDAKSLAAIDRWQRRIAKLPGVQLVIGPGQAAKRVEPLQDLGNGILASNGNIGPVKQLGKLGRSLAVAAGGVGQLRSGLAEASDGAGLLAEGSGRATEGARQIAVGLGRATRGSQRAVQALGRFAKGSKRLAGALHLASRGALELKLGLNTVEPNLARNALPRSRRLEKSLNEDANAKLPQLLAPAKVADEQLKAALAQLQGMTVGQTDPNYTAALEAVRRASAAVSGTNPADGQPYAAGYAGLPTELTALDERLLDDHEEAKQVTAWVVTTVQQLKKLRTGAIKLNSGLVRVSGASQRLASGSSRLAAAAQTLGDGLSRLGLGAVSLTAGINRLTGGSEALERSLAEGFDRSAPLQSGLRRASVRVLGGKARIKHQARRVHRASPGLFNSGYFVLSALDGAPPKAREAAGTTIDLNHGGQAATVRVISKYSFNTPGSISLDKRLNKEAGEFNEETGLSTGVAGGVAQLNEFSHVTRNRIPLIIAVITLVTFLVLIAVLRAIPLAAIAVGLNLATVAVAFGILTLLFNVPADLPLGGNSYVDAVSATMIFGVVFGLSIDYAVFLLVRMREHYDREGDNAAAIHFGLEKTARVITGAAAIMMAVFISFASASIAGVSQLGIGLTVAVILDATVVRIVLLPALMLMIGDRVWWFPRFLDRVVPKFNV